MGSVQLMARFKKLKFAANLSTMFNELPFIERFPAARESGFDAVEILNPYVMPLEKLKDLKNKNDLKVVLINSPPGEDGEFGLTCIPGREFDFQMNLKQAIEYAYGLGCPRVHILAGLTNDKFMNSDFRRTYINNLRSAAEMLEEYCLTGLIEPISPTVKENYFLNSFETAVQILEELQSPQVKLLLDVYHLKMLTGTVDGLVGYLQYSDYIQVSQAPGRHEPSYKGEINYQEVFNLLEQHHYSGRIGLEYKPSVTFSNLMTCKMGDQETEKPPDVKEDDESEIQAEDQKPTDDSSKDSDKDSIKQDSAKEESGKEESGKDESEDESEEVGLLDRPVEVTGCRARKKVERLEISFATPKEKQEIPVGKGQKLGECPRIEFQIQRNKLPDLKPLHKILFNRVGSGNEIKKNIRKFCGFTFEKNSQEYERKKAAVEKLTAAILKHVCEVLDLERSGTKEEIVLRILEFLLNPKDSGKKVPSKKKLSSGHEKRKSKEKKSKNSEKKVKTKKEVSDDDDDDEEPESPDSAADVSEDASEDDVDDSDDEPKKKSKNTSKTKETSGKGKAKKNEKVANKIKKEEKRTVGKGSKRKHDDDSDASSEDDEPIQKKSKMPTDDEIKTLVRQILDEADLQEITMKKVIKQVSDAYPDCDLSHKKAFIKTTIKSVIS